MNQELKEQAHKEFEDIIEHLPTLDNSRNLNNKWKKKFKSLLDSLIDKTVQTERERIVGIIENIHTKHYIPEHFNPIENREHFGYRKAQMDIKNYLITNKSDINKDTL